MQYELYDGIVPPGMPERSVAVCQSVGKAIKSWRRGALLTMQKGACRALLELMPGNPLHGESAWLNIKVRGKARNEPL